MKYVIKLKAKCIMAFAIIFINTYATAQWSSNSKINTPICNLTSKQKDPRIIEDGVGGSYIAWKDWRNNAVPDIYVQRFNKNGTILWSVNGLSACNDPKDQSTPNLILDDKYGVIVAWSDWRSNIERDLYAQKFDSSGNIKWMFNGAVVTNKTNREHNEKIASDTAGGCYVIWEQQGSGGWDVWGQHLNSNGVAQWTSGGKALTNIISNKINPKVQADGQGGIFVVWQDLRNATNDYDIYGQHLDPMGTLLWGSAGKLIAGGANVQIDPKIDPDKSAGGIYVSWIDGRNGNATYKNYDIYAQRIDSAGNALWAADGEEVIKLDSNQSAQDMISNNKTGGVIIAWKDNRNGNYDIYTQALNKDGKKRWANIGVPLCMSAADQINPNICSDNGNGAIIAWQHGIGNQFDIRAQHIDSMGNIYWANNGSVVSDADSSQLGPKNISDGNGGSVMVWEDYRNTNMDIYCNKINADGSLWPLALENNSKGNGLKLWPNPAANNLIITGTNLNRVQDMVIVNAQGQIIMGLAVNKISESEMEINNISALNNGIYFILLKNNNYTNTLRFIKE
jgi:predicted lipoprotein with Yx(FWY)xxD motif